MFGRRRSEAEAAADAVREAERHTLFTKLAERPEAICPFLGLADDRTGYVEGINDDHRCFAFGEPAAISDEQQVRVCQEPGYGNCPRYLRGVLVIPTDELEALRRPQTPLELAAAPSRGSSETSRRRRVPALLVIGALVLLIGGSAGAFLLLGDPGVASATPTALPSTPDPPASATTEPTSAPSATADASAVASPTPEPTPGLGDEFAFYDVSVGPSEYTLYDIEASGDIAARRFISFVGFSFAQAEPVEDGNGDVYWLTLNGDLAGWSYRYPESGEFRIRAVFLNSANERRSVYLEQDALNEFPEAEPAP